jgi:hypothetical protein
MSRGKQRHAARLSELERALRIAREKHFLETEDVGLKLGDGLFDPLIDTAQALAMSRGAGCDDRSVREMMKTAPYGLNHTPACNDRTRVNP